MNKYQKGKEKARQQAKEWQIKFATTKMSMNEIAWDNWGFTELGKRYGLLKEFRENGII